MEKKLIINSPYCEPAQYWHNYESDKEAEQIIGRRPAGYFVVGQVRGGTPRAHLITLPKIEEIRARVTQWRAEDYPSATPISHDLLAHWHTQQQTEGSVFKAFFCQLEAIETLIYLTETAEGQRLATELKQGGGDWKRFCCKMATGTGKTIVMAMTIVWQTLNAVTYSKKTKQYTKNILIMAPNLTVKSRLGVLHPAAQEDNDYKAQNYYEKFDLVPTQYKTYLAKANIQIENWHTLAWDNDDKMDKKKGVDKRGAKSDKAYSDEILTGLGKVKNILVLNDEAHHAWRLPATSKVKGIKKEDLRNATIWVGGLDKIHKARGILRAYDFSATPFAPSGKKADDAAVFSWIVSDFGLHDAIESGLVKTPRMVVRDDGILHKLGNTMQSALTHLYEHRDINGSLVSKESNENTPLPPMLLNAYALLVEDWCNTRDTQWGQREVPNVMITVCNSTTTAARVEKAFLEKSIPFVEKLYETAPLFSTEGILQIDSTILANAESKRVALQLPTDKTDLTKDELGIRLREKVTNVGKKNSTGAKVANVISVAMLSEGWDANTVTQIMGLRAFTSQLLCEQVIGRGLRRTSYEVDAATGLLRQEYVTVFGIPFAFLPSEHDKPAGAPPTIPPKTEIYSEDKKQAFAIEIPNVERIVIEKKTHLTLDIANCTVFTIDPNENITEAEIAGIIEGQSFADRSTISLDVRDERLQTLIYKVTLGLFKQDEQQWKGRKELLLVQLLGLVERFIDSGKIQFKADLLLSEKDKQTAYKLHMNSIVAHVFQQIKSQNIETITAHFSKDRPSISTDQYRNWWTSKPTQIADKSHINLIVLDSALKASNSYTLDTHPDVKAWVKNDHLGFSIWYVHEGITRRYFPDFIVKFQDDSHVVIETKGDYNNEAQAKEEALKLWTRAVSESKKFGVWHMPILSTDVKSLKVKLTRK